MELDYIGKIVIAVAFLLAVLFIIWVLRDKLFSFLENLKDIFRFGG